MTNAASTGAPPADLPVTVELVRALLEQQHPDLAPLPLAAPVEGWDMAMLRLGTDLAVRVPRHSWGAEGLGREIRWVAPLAETWDFPVQRVLRTGSATPE